jgi:hypothetical protein
LFLRKNSLINLFTRFLSTDFPNRLLATAPSRGNPRSFFFAMIRKFFVCLLTPSLAIVSKSPFLLRRSSFRSLSSFFVEAWIIPSVAFALSPFCVSISFVPPWYSSAAKIHGFSFCLSYSVDKSFSFRRFCPPPQGFLNYKYNHSISSFVKQRPGHPSRALLAVVLFCRVPSNPIPIPSLVAYDSLFWLDIILLLII